MTKRCLYCGRYGQKVENNKSCKDCEKELNDVREKFINKTRNGVTTYERFERTELS